MADFLAQQKAKHLYRQPRIIGSAQQPTLVVDGKPCLSFCSNDYLGLANHPELIKAFQAAANSYGVGSGSAHLVSGHNIEHQKLEESLAEFTGRERALLFSTGYMANLGVIAAFAEKGDTIYQDRLNHASLIDGGRLSGAKMWRYKHNDMADLEKRLGKEDGRCSMIITDGVFSMDGDVADVKALADIAKREQSWLMVDDAHGFGCLGANGGGLVEALGLSSDDVPLLMATLGKAVGSSGAFLAGDHDLIEYLIQSARSYIFTTAIPPAVAAASRKSLQIIQAEPWLRAQLDKNIQQFKHGAAELGLTMMPSDTAIQPIMVGDSETAIHYSQQLMKQGIMVTAIRPPTVPKGEARLRVTLSASHTETQIEQLLVALESLDMTQQPEYETTER
ncbi:8-amino-7-oxononanoate synthase [Leucothrix sargassi]|nr:8-amino-7-oxononanoate synthase [Leucothrix sargassi]